MKHEFAYEEAQRHLRQRNRFAALAAVLGLTSLLAIGAAATREESVILVPVTSERLSLGSDATDALYLELVRRGCRLVHRPTSRSRYPRRGRAFRKPDRRGGQQLHRARQVRVSAFRKRPCLKPR